MKKEVKICITATDCGDGVLRGINLNVSGPWRALLDLVRIHVVFLAEKVGVPVPALLAVIAAMSERKSSSVTIETGAIREAMKRMGDDKGAT